MAADSAEEILAAYRKQFDAATVKVEKAEAAYLDRLTAFKQAEKRLKVVEGELKLATAQVTTLAKVFVYAGIKSAADAKEES